MKKLVVLLTLLVAFGWGEAQELNLRVGTYNVWSHLARTSKVRKGDAAEERS